jgi:predicted RNA-binding Zn ribbon-like protein
MSNSTKRLVFELTGGALCLDFANTVDKRPDHEHRQDHLASYADLLSWLTQTRNLSSKEAHQLTAKVDRRRGEAVSLFHRAIALREAIYAIFSAIARGRRPAGRDLDSLNSVISKMMARMRVVPQGGGFDWKWSVDEKALESLLWPIARSAADLLTSDRLQSVRECAAEDCGWLFIDKSANQRRRWCDMKVCGNRAKARRHYERSRRIAAGRTILRRDSHASPFLTRRSTRRLGQ